MLNLILNYKNEHFLCNVSWLNITTSGFNKEHNDNIGLLHYN